MKFIAKEDLIIRRSFSLPYANTEIWCCGIDSLSVHTDVAINKFLQELPEMYRPSAPSIVFINLSETLVNKEFAELMVTRLIPLGRLKKIAFVGPTLMMRSYIASLFRKHDSLFAYGFFPTWSRQRFGLLVRDDK